MAFIFKSPYQNLILFGLGALSALGFAPLFWWPCTVLGLSGAWFLYDKILAQFSEASPYSRLWKAASLGWFFSLGHFVIGLYWITNALTIDLASFGWLIPFSLFGLPAILAIFMCIPFGLTALLPSSGFSRILIFSAVWIGAEWLRGHVFTGFPWNLLGYVWGVSLEISQTASLVGVYGLSLLTLLMALSWEWVWKPSTSRKLTFLGVYLMGGALWVWGYERLAFPNVMFSPPLGIRLVQPNIPQTLKWDPAERDRNFQKLLSLTRKPSALSLKAVIWPESAISFFLEFSPLPCLLIAESLPRGALLFTGALRRTAPDITPTKVWNSLLVLNDRGDIVAHYDKSHLVPFGEYLPLRDLCDALLGKHTLKKLTAGTLDFTPGAGPQSISPPEDFPSFSGLVCYEVIFPKAIIHPTQPRPHWIVNVTNDAWYGNSSGPYQHLEAARFRAIEEGLPLVRVANSGVSAVFDAYGRLIKSLPLSTEGILDLFLPCPTYRLPLYARWGDSLVLALIVSLLICGWVFRRARD